MKLSDLTPNDWFLRLNIRRNRFIRAQAANWRYYDGEQPLHYVAKIIREQQDRFPALVINWPALVIDALEERLTIEGFRLGQDDSPDEDLVNTWQANNLDSDSSEAHIAALVTGHAYLMVGPGDGAYPLITVEYPDQLAVEIDPRTRRVIAALKLWKSDENEPAYDMAELHLPGRKVDFELGQPVAEAAETWTEVNRREQSSPLVPVVPLLNRPRRGFGRTELQAIKPLADAVNQTATNMMAGIEHHSLPRRWAVGAREADFVDPKTGKPLPAWKIATGAVWALNGETPEENQYIKIGQFSASDMTNYHNSIKLLASVAGTLYGLPAHYMAYTTDNPVSAEAILYSEARLVKRAERRQVAFDGPWEQAMRFALEIMGRDPRDARALETVWRDASTPTQASKMAAAVQGVQSGLLDEEAGREFIGMSIQQRAAIAGRQGSAAGFVSTVVNGLKQLNAVTTGQSPAASDTSVNPNGSFGAQTPLGLPAGGVTVSQSGPRLGRD